MAKQSAGLSWFRVYATARGTFEAIPDNELGAALKEAMRYFEAVTDLEAAEKAAAKAEAEKTAAGENAEAKTRAAAEAAEAKAAAEAKVKHIEKSISPHSLKAVAFMTLKTGIEDSFKARIAAAEYGRKGQQAKKEKANSANLEAALDTYGGPEPEPQTPWKQ